MKRLIILSVLATLVGCSTIPPEYTKGENKSCIKTVSSMKDAWLLVSSIDDGDIIYHQDPKTAWLFSNRHNKPEKIWLTPGNHKITFMVAQQMASGAEYIHHNSIMLNIEEGMSYEFKATKVNSTKELSEIFINKVSTAQISKSGRDRNWVSINTVSPN